MKVTLLKAVGDHPEGAELEINDTTVLKKWVELKVIDHIDGLETEDSEEITDESDMAKRIYTAMTVAELKAVATEKELPTEEWEKLKKEELVNYLTENLKSE